MAFIPHTTHQVAEMLQSIGADSIDELFNEIPDSLRFKRELDIPDALNEMQMMNLLSSRAQKDSYRSGFIGAGAYEHYIPAAVWQITSRGEFLTAYTPYQAEASQGTLQLLYEYQTMMASLCGMDVSNASMYDGATAVAEAILMAIRSNRQNKSRRILILGEMHPYYRQTVHTIVESQDITVELIPANDLGQISDAQLKQIDAEFTAVVIAQPNFFGILNEVDKLTDWAHSKGALVIGVVNPIALALLKEPGSWGEHGADFACGEGQPLGISLASGGPYFGFLCCKQKYVRQLPGRIVGRTHDSQGRQGFTLTLQAREQHIRRAKATSNICTNQGLAVTAATIYMSIMGPQGLSKVAQASHHNTRHLAKQLAQIDGVNLKFKQPYFHEIVVEFATDIKKLMAFMADKGVLAGFDLTTDYPELGQCLLICATETKTEEDLDNYIALAKEFMAEVNK